jgi:hypothetical protein
MNIKCPQAYRIGNIGPANKIMDTLHHFFQSNLSVQTLDFHRTGQVLCSRIKQQMRFSHSHFHELFFVANLKYRIIGTPVEARCWPTRQLSVIHESVNLSLVWHI